MFLLILRTRNNISILKAIRPGPESELEPVGKSGKPACVPMQLTA
ncbi:hypothetical protein [Nitratireductor basaltis]|nr:hypothetical protein [Nitratireductor basaltis]